MDTCRIILVAKLDELIGDYPPAIPGGYHFTAIARDTDGNLLFVKSSASFIKPPNFETSAGLEVLDTILEPLKTEGWHVPTDIREKWSGTVITRAVQ